MPQNKLFARLLWPVLGLGLLGLAVLQARATVSSPRTARNTCRASSPAVSSSAWRWPAPSRASR